MSPIYLRLGRPSTDISVGKSHWWGYPDLPLDVDIPTTTDADGSEYALDFICQINLADLHDYLVETAADTGDRSVLDCPLPQSGLLLFFADIAYYRGNWDEPAISMHYSDTDVVKAIYIPEDDMAALVSCEDVYADDALPAQPIDFARERGDFSQPDHRLLGPADYREWEDWDAPFCGWEVLLQMDSCEDEVCNINFVDCGVLDLIISPDDLARHDFSNVRAIILST